MSNAKPYPTAKAIATVAVQTANFIICLALSSRLGFNEQVFVYSHLRLLIVYHGIQDTGDGVNPGLVNNPILLCIRYYVIECTPNEVKLALLGWGWGIF